MISIIIRTKNEERWITACLHAVFSQRHRDFEVILVDNESTDRTVEKAKQFRLAKVVTCTDYRPGKALNAGIREAHGEFIVCLSGHCIPVNEHWLEHLLRNFEDAGVAGVYGRQEPMAFTPDTDKRDLVLLFGMDRKVQRKDSFFHNANSMIRRALWEQVPFDEQVTNIEDRVWAQQMLQRGHTIVYEPEASVYHYHGVHQNGNVERCTNVVRILEQLHAGYGDKSLEAERLNVVAVIPVKGEVQYVNGEPLLRYTVHQALHSRLIKRTIVSTDTQELARLAQSYGAETPFLRGPELSQPHVDIARVLQYSLERIEQLGVFPDIVVSLEVTFPFRPPGLLDDMIAHLVRSGFDSVVAARAENRAIWQQREGQIEQVSEGLTPRQFKDPTFVELRGVGCVTHPEFLRQGRVLGSKIGMYEVNNPYSHLEVRSAADCQMAAVLLNEWSRLMEAERRQPLHASTRPA